MENPVGGILTFKARSEQSDGQLTVVETIAAPGEGPPLHVHRHEDEFIYTLEGRFRLKLADELLEADPGSFVFIPRGTPHTWQNTGAKAGRFVAGVTPAAEGFEQFFVRYGRLADDERGEPAFRRLASETNAIEVVGPPLARSSP